MKVRDVIVNDFVYVPRSALVVDVAQKMKDLATDVIPVCENGKLRGIITGRDIITSIADIGGNTSNLSARLLMNNHYPIIQPGEDTLQAAEVMVHNGVRVLPVAQNGKLLGLFTLDDLARASMFLAAMTFAKTAKMAMEAKV